MYRTALNAVANLLILTAPYMYVPTVHMNSHLMKRLQKRATLPETAMVQNYLTVMQ